MNATPGKEEVLRTLQTSLTVDNDGEGSITKDVLGVTISMSFDILFGPRAPLLVPVVAEFMAFISLKKLFFFFEPFFLTFPPVPPSRKLRPPAPPSLIHFLIPCLVGVRFCGVVCGVVERGQGVRGS